MIHRCRALCLSLAVLAAALAGCATAPRRAAAPPRAPTAEEKLTVAGALLPLLALSGVWRGPADGCAVNFGVLLVDTVNLGVAPDRQCRFALVVTDGALRRLDALELQAALAHEIGHIALGHFEARDRRRQAERETQKRIDATGAVGGVAGAIPGIGPLLAVGAMATQTITEVAAKSAYRRYDRREELAADAFAVDLLDRVGPGRCRTLVALLARMQRESASGSSVGWLDDHPSFAARRDAAAAACRRGGGPVSQTP